MLNFISSYPQEPWKVAYYLKVLLVDPMNSVLFIKALQHKC